MASNESSSSSSAFPLPAPPSSATAAAAAASSTTPMAASSSTPSGGGSVIMPVPYAHSPQPSASSPHTPTSTPSSSSSNSAVQSTAQAGPSNASGGAAPTRNKRQELSFAERIQVILARKSGKSMRQLAVQFGCGKTQILNILGQREAYLREWDEKQAESNPHISSRKRRSRRTGNEETNRLVWEWYTAQREQGIRVTGPMLQREARSIARGLGIANFAASNGWLDSFRRLHNIGPQSRALQQQQQQQQQQQSRLAQTSGQPYPPFGTNGNNQHHLQDPSIPTIAAAYSLDPEAYGHHHPSTEALSPAASSSTGSSSHLGHHSHGVLPPPPPLEAFGSDVYHHQHHQPEYYVEEDEDDEAGDYYQRRDYHSPEVPRMHPQQHQHITSTFTELYPSNIMQQHQQQQHQQQQGGAQQVSGHSPRLLVQQSAIHDERSNLLVIGQPIVQQQQQQQQQHQQQQHHVQQPAVRRSVLVSTRAAAAALESQLHNQQQLHDALQQSADQQSADEKRRAFAAASSSESSSSGLELLSASSSTFGQLTSMARQKNLAYFQYSDDHGDVWLEIRPPPTGAFRVPLYGYRTHLMRLLVDRHLTYWLEAIGHCVRNGTLRSPANEFDASQIEQLLDLLAGGAAVCQGRGSVLKRVHQFHPKAAIEQGIAGSNYFTLPDYRYRAYDCARLVDARSGSNQCAACLRPPEPPPPPLEVISPPGPQSDSPMDSVQEERSDEPKRSSDAEPLNLSVHPPVMGVLRFPSPQAFSNFAPPFESGALLRGGAEHGTESNVEDYRLAQEAAYLSIHAHPRERSVSAEGSEWVPGAASSANNGADYQERRARSDSPVQLLQQHHLEAARGGSKGASPAFDPEFHTTWVKQETLDSPQSNGS